MCCLKGSAALDEKSVPQRNTSYKKKSEERNILFCKTQQIILKHGVGSTKR
jgi:hypothetical protein